MSLSNVDSANIEGSLATRMMVLPALRLDPSLVKKRSKAPIATSTTNRQPLLERHVRCKCAHTAAILRDSGWIMQKGSKVKAYRNMRSGQTDAGWAAGQSAQVAP